MARRLAKSLLVRLTLLLLAVNLSFWLAPAPRGQPDVEYWGHYQRVGPGLGFVVNHDSYGYLLVARQPARLLRPGEVRQSRPLYALLGTVVGYPLAAALRAGQAVGIIPSATDPERLTWAGFYGGYVLLNGLALLLSLLLLRYLVGQSTVGRDEMWLFWPLAWVLTANPVTKAFFWTAHQQMLTLLVPLFCLALAVRLRLRQAAGLPLSQARQAALAVGLGLLPLLYGSFVLVWPALIYGLSGRRAGAKTGYEPANHADFTQLPSQRFNLAAAGRQAARLALSLGLFALPTLLWVGLLRTQGTAYYNHEAARYHQLVWLLEVPHWPLTDFLALVAAQLGAYVRSWEALTLWLVLAAGLGGATWLRVRWAAPSGAGTEPARSLLRAPLGGALAWVAGSVGLFFGLLGYYQPRLAYALLPLVLVWLAALLPRWPRRWAWPLAWAGAAGWYLWTLLSYGPFS